MIKPQIKLLADFENARANRYFQLWCDNRGHGSYVYEIVTYAFEFGSRYKQAHTYKYYSMDAAFEAFEAIERKYAKGKK